MALRHLLALRLCLTTFLCLTTRLCLTQWLRRGQRCRRKAHGLRLSLGRAIRAPWCRYIRVLSSSNRPRSFKKVWICTALRARISHALCRKSQSGSVS